MWVVFRPFGFKIQIMYKFWGVSDQRFTPEGCYGIVLIRVDILGKFKLVGIIGKSCGRILKGS